MRIEQQDQFEDLRNISAEVANYLSNDLYKLTYSIRDDEDDNRTIDLEYTAQDILRDCYTIILDELQELGIQFDLSRDELLQDFYTAKHIYYARKVASFEYLYELLNDKSITDYIEQKISENDEDIANIFIDLIRFIANKKDNNDNNPDEIKYLFLFTSTIQSTIRFKNHLSTIYQRYKIEDKATTITDIDKSIKYLRFIQEGRRLARVATDIIIDKLDLTGKYDKSKMDSLVDSYDIDKISPDTINIYTTVDNQEVANLPEDNPLKIIHNKYMDIHHNNSPHHIEHWIKKYEHQKITLRNKITHMSDITPEVLIILTAHHLEPTTKTVNDFIRGVETMIEKSMQARLLTNIQIEFISQAKMVICNNFPTDTNRAKNIDDIKDFATKTSPISVD